VFATMTFLAVVVVLIFSFAFVVEGARPPAPVVAGILWVAVVVSGTVALSRAFDREREGEAIRSLLLSPAPRGAIYLGKLTATVCLMLVTETVLTGMCAVLFAAGFDEMLARVALLLFDEPSAALDPAGAAWLQAELAAERAAGRTVVLVTHDLDATAAIADQVLILRRGRVVADETRAGGFPIESLRGLYREATGG
jgi:ABC-type transport system involved in cytochrome c biogenesis permease component